ncbi:MAG: oxidoreductase [Zetaproteobacteria bacterium CG_4_9_14_3_um_filter_53_7]|nr:MAG: oxidoreductase [Zetaproteobacteria bacterium CG_4_9_14_3_um_filter_53_7]
MKVGFAGAGAVGCHYGSKLKQAGFDVRLLARGAHLAALQGQGLLHDSCGQQARVQIEASDDADALADCQVVVLSCKMTGLDAMLAALEPVVNAQMLLVTLQNGVEAPDRVAQAFPSTAVVAGSAFIGARIEQPGYLIHSAAGGIRLGRWQQGAGEHFLTPLLAAFNAADVPASEDENAAVMLWRKLLWNCGFNAVTALTRRFAKDMAAGEETLAVVRQAMAETVAVAQKIGIAIDAQEIDKHIQVTLQMGPVKTSMWQDLEAGHQTEVDFLNGYVARMGEQLGIATETNRLLTTLVHALEGR